jgi:hypothetical protein
MALKQIDGLPIIDAKRPLVVHVTAEDITKADRKEPTDCVMARACRRDAHVKEARIHLGRVYLRSNKGNWVRYMTPRYLRTEIIAFDRGGDFAAGEYTLSAPHISHRASGKGQGSKTNKTRPKRYQKPRHKHLVANVRESITRKPTDGL